MRFKPVFCFANAAGGREKEKIASGKQIIFGSIPDVQSCKKNAWDLTLFGAG
jgi:hypothetical protein